MSFSKIKTCICPQINDSKVLNINTKMVDILLNNAHHYPVSRNAPQQCKEIIPHFPFQNPNHGNVYFQDSNFIDAMEEQRMELSSKLNPMSMTMETSTATMPDSLITSSKGQQLGGQILVTFPWQSKHDDPCLCLPCGQRGCYVTMATINSCGNLFGCIGVDSLLKY